MAAEINDVRGRFRPLGLEHAYGLHEPVNLVVFDPSVGEGTLPQFVARDDFNAKASCHASLVGR
jgi:hypothetical protein